MRQFIDERYPDSVITIDELEREFCDLVNDGDIDPTEITFADYVRNCMYYNGGTLTEIV